MAATDSNPNGAKQGAGVENQMNPPVPASENSVILTTPPPGQDTVVAVVPGEQIVVDFDLGEAILKATQTDLVIDLGHGTTVTLQDFRTFAGGDQPPMVVLADGTVVAGDDLIFSLGNEQVDPAAGPEAAGSGVGEYRDDVGDILAGLGRLGPQDPGTFATVPSARIEDEGTLPAEVAAAGPDFEPSGPPAGPPSVEPPVPPANLPPANEPLVDEPPVDEPPVDEPPVDEPPVDEPPVDEPPVDEPPVDEPPVDEPPVDEPPVDEPPVDEPPVDEPPVDEPPINNPPEVQDAAATVSDEGLPGGITDPQSKGSSASGTISITDVDNETFTITLDLADPELTSGGQKVEWTGQNTNVLAGAVNGTPVLIISIDNEGHYEVTQLGPIDHPAAGEEDALFFSLTINVDDGTDVTSATLTVTIEDDMPEISGTEDATLSYDPEASFTGSLGIAYGGDGPADPGTLQITGISAGDPVLASDGTTRLTADGVNLIYAHEGGDLVAVKESNPGYIAFRISLDADAGSYTVTLEGGLDGGPSSTLIDLTDASSIHGGIVDERLIDVFLNDDSTPDAVLVATGAGASGDNTVNFNNNAMGVGNGAKIDPGDTLRLEYHDLTEGGLAGDFATITQAQVGAWHLDASETVEWFAYLHVDGVQTLVGSGTFTGSDDKFDFFTVRPTETDPGTGEKYAAFDTIEFASTDSTSSFGINHITIQDQDFNAGVNQTITLDFSLTDADGDSANGSFDVTFDAGSSQVMSDPIDDLQDSPSVAGTEEFLLVDILVDADEIFSFSALGGEGKHSIHDFDLGKDTLRLVDVLDANHDSVLDASDVNVAVAVDGADLTLTITGSEGSTTTVTLEGINSGGVFTQDTTLDQLISNGLNVELSENPS